MTLEAEAADMQTNEAEEKTKGDQSWWDKAKAWVKDKVDKVCSWLMIKKQTS